MSNTYSDDDFCDNCSEVITKGVLYNGSVICQRCYKSVKKQDRKAENVRRKREENNEDNRF